MPIFIQDKIRFFYYRYFGNFTIKRWYNKGKPLPPPHIIKQKTIESYQYFHNCTTFIETGTYLGDMVNSQINNFNEIYSIEIDENLWRRALKRFKKYKKINIILGDSGTVLKELMPDINSKALFWLDGHNSAGITAKGNKDCPIYEELDAILNINYLDHVILIDDARCFIGKGDYPKSEDLEKYLLSKNSNYEMKIENDIIRFTIK